MDVLEELKAFYARWQGEKGYIGCTENGVLIPYFAVRKSQSPVIVAQYAIHAREYITTYLAMMQAEDFACRGKRGCVFFVPAVNMDGIAEALHGDGLYKANANRVDLNVNFDARWGEGEKNVRTPCTENYIGAFPFSESETRALRDFTLMVKPDVTVSYHSKGEEIYWEFFQHGKDRKRDFYLAKRLSAATGYPLRSAGKSAGGYKDWCVEKLKIPSFTIEVGSDALTHPIGKEFSAAIFEKNKGVIYTLTKNYGKRKKIYARGDTGSLESEK